MGCVPTRPPGVRVALFDGSHPREKPCGGGVTGRALSLVSAVPAIATLPRVRIDSARFEFVDRPDAIVSLGRPAGDALAVASRRAFDSALLAAAADAGAGLIAERVLDVRVAPSGVEFETATARYRAAKVLGADGATSLVRRRLATPFPRSQISIATGVFAHGLSTTEIVIRFTTNPPGYGWSFPRPDHLAIEICAQANLTDVTTLRRLVDDWLDQRPVGPAVSLERYSWPIPSLDAAAVDRERPAGDRWMLLGDAAGLVDPITREGIYFALRSAELAASAIVGKGSPGAVYAAALGDDIYAELRRAAQFKRAFFRPRFLRLLHDALGQSTAVRAVMADLVAGRQPYRGLRRRLLATMELGLAWRLLTRGD